MYIWWESSGLSVTQTMASSLAKYHFLVAFLARYTERKRCGQVEPSSYSDDVCACQVSGLYVQGFVSSIIFDIF